MRHGGPDPCRRASLRAALAIVSAVLVVPAAAQASIGSVFNGTATPVPCATLQNGVRLCDELAFQPERPRSTVKTFDGVPIDVRVAFPRAPASGPDGPYPLIMAFHRWAGEKLPLQGLSWWLARGYAALTMTERGFGESCGTPSARQADVSGCGKGYVRLMDTRYEVRDAQELAGHLVDDGLVDPARIGATGNSYAGAKAVALAALKNRKMLPSGALVPWTSPRGTPISLAAASAASAWTDLVAALVPNGSTLDYVADAPYRGRTGVLKESGEAALFYAGLPYHYAAAGADPSADISGWHAVLHAGEPYDNSAGSPLSAVAAMRTELTSFHSAYYIDDSEPPAPLLMSGGWTDDLFPADEAIRFYNRSRTRHLGVPISLFLADLGHPRSQHKHQDAAAMGAAQEAWMEHYVRGVGDPPFQGVKMLTETCPASAPSGGPHLAANWAAAAPGEIRIDSTVTERISPSAGSDVIAQAFDPYAGGGACATAPAADQAGTATYRGTPAPPGGFTLVGSPTLVASITSRGQASQIAARLLDVDPATGTEVLVARGLWRPLVSSAPVLQVFQLHPNAYRFAEGHVAKLELLPRDSPYGRVSNAQEEVRVSSAQLRLPVLETPGSLGGLVRAPAPKVLPFGYALARDFREAAYPRPRGATPVQVALVPAFARCMTSNRIHGAPLAYPSCAPPAQSSERLTVGAPDANGQFANSLGFAALSPVLDDPLTPALEADVRIEAAITDVRRSADLGDYTGELESRTTIRITDRSNGSSEGETGAGTVVDAPLSATLQCGATAVADEGAACAVATTANAIAPGAVVSGRRAIWEVGAVEVYDGGADGAAATADGAAVFAVQGLFLP